MDILNKKERFNAFMLFLLMFFITMIVLISAIFFNYKLPIKENEVLKNENDKMNMQYSFNKEFSNTIEDINKLVDSLDAAPESFQFIEQSINYELVQLKEKIPNDSIVDPKLYQNVILTYKTYVNTKKKLLQINDSKKEIDKMDKELKELADENKDLARQLQMCEIVSRNR
ncbi:type VI secretion system TssO [Flavobacterium gelidilacus]|jgi:peptidoglycan hydrolase CwlO-like protein|uniref:type VI secretion system TssO n=1 Tax=Flavobacterium gelidilacus TaxID=206041 RepID=UPI0004291542|nr:type VI secretion system TssO [Flavobacterium gelidilacus]